MVISLRQQREAPRGRHTPKLWSVWIVAPLALLVVAALSLVVFHYVYGLLSHPTSTQKPRKPVDINDVIKTTVTVLTLMGAVLAGIYAYRKQLLAEGDAHRADASQLADRYTTAAEQLGHEQAAVRLAGVYALARLADDWEEQRQVCIDVLCAYLRMPYQPDPSAEGHKIGEREVRLTVISIIRDHLRHPDATTAWSTYALDFTGATLDGGDFSQCHFRGPVSFNNATLSGGEVRFGNASIGEGTVSFEGATIRSGVDIEWGPLPQPPRA
ncbi:pentapeptide repeat-containing protein [Streptomyces nanshensis]|uniref:pentapeptide repeat-containing protein n=1 Tax=Streptomyces nanshensis TaxID=518642 RepID=UPI00085CADFC|nr:pentapeptide repeat-containing protein [Streptomyces nanshensis]